MTSLGTQSISPRWRHWVALLGIPLVAACGDALSVDEEIPPEPISVRPSAGVAMRVSVDAVTGEMRFDPVASGPADGVSAQIYGDQNVNVRLYNVAPTITTTAALRTLTAHVGIRNLRPHPIGDEQSGSVPSDTMGIHVFFTSEPVVTGTSGACPGGCMVRIANPDGSASFDQPIQKYFFYPERLGAFGAAAGDTTRLRRPWVFEMSPEVTNFQAFVLISAAWPAPHDTRWKVRYQADLAPDAAKPRWRTVVNGSGGGWSTSGGVLSLSGNGNNNVRFVRRDSLASSTSAYIEAMIDVPTGNSNPKAVIGIADGQRVIALGVGRGMAGLLNGSEQYIASTTNDDIDSGAHVYQLRKYGADSIVYYVDGARQAKLLYSSMPAAAGPSQFYFGTDVTMTGTQSLWYLVTYEIGSPSP